MGAEMGAETSNSTCSGSLRKYLSYLYVYDLYRRSSLAIRCIVGSLTPTINNFRNDCPGSFEINAWALSITAEVLVVRFFEWLFLAGILKSSLDCCPYILPHHKRLVSGIQRTELFRCWAPSAKAFDDAAFLSTLRTWFQYRGHIENMTVY